MIQNFFFFFKKDIKKRRISRWRLKKFFKNTPTKSYKLNKFDEHE
jgi:hypothetical protein